MRGARIEGSWQEAALSGVLGVLGVLEGTGHICPPCGSAWSRLWLSLWRWIRRGGRWEGCEEGDVVHTGRRSARDGWWLELAQGHPVETVPAESLLGSPQDVFLSVCFLAAWSDVRDSNEGRLWQRV